MSFAQVTLFYTVGPLGGGGIQTPGSTGYTLSGSGPVTLDFDLPIFPGYRTTYQGISVFRFEEQGDDFQGFNPLYFDPTDATGGLTYLWTWPNSEAGSDFTDVDAADYPQGAYLLPAEGWGWNGAGTFDSADYAAAGDDLQSYAAGSAPFLAGGAGWAGIGRCLISDYFTAPDDLQTYTTGAITALTAYPPNMGSTAAWSGNGIFLFADYLLAQDDLQNYAAGPILSLNAGSGWSANGNFL